MTVYLLSRRGPQLLHDLSLFTGLVPQGCPISPVLMLPASEEVGGHSQLHQGHPSTFVCR